MERKHQIKLKLDFSVTVTEGTPEYDAAYYLKHGLLSEKEAIVIALAATYSMVGAAMRGADEQTVRDRIFYSDEAIHGYQMRSLSRLEKSCSVLEPNENTDFGAEPSQSPNLIDQNEAF